MLKNRQLSIFVITAAHTVTDLNPKARDNSFNERVEEKLIISKANLTRYKQYV